MRLKTAFALGAVFLTAPAFGQAWIGQVVGDMMAQQQQAAFERACMTGTPMKDEKVEDARAPSLLIMQNYAKAVAGGQTVSAAPYFHPGKKTRWSSAGLVLDEKKLSALQDPFGAPGLVFDPVPLAFHRAGDGITAAGQWVVKRPDGKIAGTYNAVFDRKVGIWKLQQLNLVDTKSYAEPLVQYCHKVGDVLPYRLESAKWMRTYTEKRYSKGLARAAAANVEFAKAQAAVDAAKPSARPAKIAAAKLAAEKAAKQGEDLATRKTVRDLAAMDEQLALADAAAAEDRKAAALAAIAATP